MDSADLIYCHKCKRKSKNKDSKIVKTIYGLYRIVAVILYGLCYVFDALENFLSWSYNVRLVRYEIT